jgi:hypothetical protein
MIDHVTTSCSFRFASLRFASLRWLTDWTRDLLSAPRLFVTVGVVTRHGMRLVSGGTRSPPSTNALPLFTLLIQQLSNPLSLLDPCIRSIRYSGFDSTLDQDLT